MPPVVLMYPDSTKCPANNAVISRCRNAAAYHNLCFSGIGSNIKEAKTLSDRVLTPYRNYSFKESACRKLIMKPRVCESLHKSFFHGTRRISPSTIHLKTTRHHPDTLILWQRTYLQSFVNIGIHCSKPVSDGGQYLRIKTTF